MCPFRPSQPCRPCPQSARCSFLAAALLFFARSPSFPWHMLLLMEQLSHAADHLAHLRRFRLQLSDHKREHSSPYRLARARRLREYRLQHLRTLPRQSLHKRHRSLVVVVLPVVVVCRARLLPHVRTFRSPPLPHKVLTYVLVDVPSFYLGGH
ncbi:hypothetical protein BBK36DRAFT_1139316 [Trichoderma citrinoviride]|uniref:Uncharacterized protein n=1 Tax=Trichoderma citrinoviride TaxID=58853 RepID=A0A2T4BEU3_9HYPO|nr:hypothetical protein BBK36DRAFT_1139316 [Trichoderma citrinoviride]PTB67788.1 hypothetical protein BBK36DRAFT_1139316 [Trichoderma citrinoviride]